MSWMSWYSTRLAILFAVGGLSLTANAQRYQPLTNVENLEMDYDWHRPLHEEDFSDGRGPRTGLFFAYDRMYMNVSRPHEAIDHMNYEIQPAFNDGIFFGGGPQTGRLAADESTNFKGDWTYGNRFELGYMTEGNSGWMFTAWKMDNPETRRVEDNIRRNEIVDEGGEIVNRPALGPVFIVPAPGSIELLRSEVGGVTRAIDLLHRPIGDTFITLNGMNYYAFDLNRVWRWKPFNRGLVVESFGGPKYVRIRDHSDRADYFQERTFVNSGILVDGTRLQPEYDAYVRQDVYTDNDLWGGQFGVRTLLRRGRWLLTSDVRGHLFNNYRSRERVQSAEIGARNFSYTFSETSVTITPTDTTGIDFRSQTFNDESERFVYGGELRLEGAFDVTEYISIRGGLQVLAFADGIGRGVTRTDEALTAGGVTFGFTINR